MAENSVNIEEKVINERVRNGLRKMIKSFDNYIKEASDHEQLEDNLKHMEETDENFHRYDLVEFLRDRIETNLGQSIEKHVNDAFSSLKFEGDIDQQNRIAQKICQDILKTKDVNEFKNSFKSNVLKANDYLSKNFYSNFIDCNSEEVTLLVNENKSVSLTNDLEFCSPDNSINHNSFVFYTSEQFPAIAQNLDHKKSDQIRLRAIQQLLSIPANDSQAADHWVEIRKYINMALRDPDEKISELCVKLHSRTLASSHYKVSNEIYINLVEHLSEYFRDKELEKRSLKHNLDITSYENNFILKIFRLINDYAKDVASKWARYPDSFIESIIDETLKLLSIGVENKFGSYMTPIHYLSLIDIQSNWFSKWMHGNDSRKVLINLIKKHESFIQTSINSIISYSNSKRAENSNTNPSRANSARKKSTSSISSVNLTTKRVIYRKNEIEYAHFVHSLNVIRKVLCFKNGRRLFPVKIANKEITIKDMIIILIQIIYDTASFRTSNEFSPFKYAYDLLQDLCVAEEACEACLCNDEVIEQLLKPLKTLMQIKKTNQLSVSTSNFNLNSTSTSTSSSNHYNYYYDEECMIMIANILSKLASTECGYKQLMFNDSKQCFFVDYSKKNSAAHVITSFVNKALTNKLNYTLSNNEIAEFLYLTRLLYSQCQGVFLIKEYTLNKCISESWNFDKENSKSNQNTPRQLNQINQKSNFTLTWSESLLDNLISMASTPKGVFYLNETQLLSQSVNYMFTRYKSKLQVGKYEKFGYGFLISQLANTPSGCFYLNESGFIQSLIDEIWSELEFGTDDFMSAFPRAYSVESIDREVYKPMLCLVNILSSFSSVYELIADVLPTPRSSYDSRHVPKGIVGFFDRIVFLDKKNKISSLFNYEQSHLFGLKLVSLLLCDLDILILIETQYNLSNILLGLQKSNRPYLRINLGKDENDEIKELNLSESNDEDDEDEDKSKSLDEKKSNIMIDILSVERNFILVNSNLIGGPNEKLLPLKDFKDSKSFSYEYPLFDQLPVPNFYVKKSDMSKYQKKMNDFDDLIQAFNYEQVIKSSESQSKWLNKFQSVYLKCLKSSNLNVETISTGLNQFVQILAKTESNNFISSINSKTQINEFKTKLNSSAPNLTLSRFQKLGVDKTIQYGNQLNQLNKNKNEENRTKLNDLHIFIKHLLKTSNQKLKNSSNDLKSSYLSYCQEEHYPGYDWFTSTIFLLNQGDLKITEQFLYNYHYLQQSSFIWSSRLFGNDFILSNVFSKNGLNILLPTTCHYIELILKTELPLIFSAFRMSGLSPSQICFNWLKQCFWNYLDWFNIINYISICIVYGIDYQTYFCVSILKHLNSNNNLNKNIIQHHTDRDLQIFLKEYQIENFKLDSYIDFMLELEKKYRKFILDDIKLIFV